MKRLLLSFLLMMALPASAQAATLAYSGCSSEQQTALGNAVNSADTALKMTLLLMNGDSTDSFLTAWFGSPGAHDRVRTVLQGISDRLQKPDTLRFICEERNCEHDLVGYVEHGGIGVCPDFFSSAAHSAYDSQPGTIIHEMTHYTVNTSDHAYGGADARRLAAQHPEQALSNADNYQYFVEAITGGLANGNQPYNTANSCRWAYDGECDEHAARAGTGACKPGTDTADCTGPVTAADPSLPRKPERYSLPTTVPDDSCPTARNGACDEPGGNGNNKCRAGTDSTDCTPSYNPKHR